MGGIPYPTPYPTLPYGVKVEGRGEVGVRSEHLVGYPTVPYPTLQSSSGLFNCTRNEMCVCGGGGGGRSEHLVDTLPYPGEEE